MQVRLFVVVLSLVICIQNGWAASFQVKADTGVVLLWQAKTNYWAAIKDSAAVGLSDSLYVDDKYCATISMGKGCALLIRGESRLCLKGTDTSAGIYFDQGQIFLKRETPSEVTAVKIVTRGCTITPIGTAAAIKLTKAGEPSVAVLRGTVRMESSKGESIVIEPGRFGTYSPDAGTFKQGSIPADAIAGLENWSGVMIEVASAPSQPAAAAPMSAPGPASAAPKGKKASEASEASTSGTGKQAASGQGPALMATAPASPGTAGKPEEKPVIAGQADKKEPAAKPAGAPGISWEVS
ncbi:MAG: hypothetical protein WBM07_01390, partial [Chitinivibrionales bacterium]